MLVNGICTYRSLVLRVAMVGHALSVARSCTRIWGIIVTIWSWNGKAEQSPQLIWSHGEENGEYEGRPQVQEGRYPD